MWAEPSPCKLIMAVTSESVDRATHAERAAIEDMGIDHGRRDVAMPEQLLYRRQVAARPARRQLSAREASVGTARRQLRVDGLSA